MANEIDEAIEHIKAIPTVSIQSGELLQYVPVNRVLRILEMANDRRDMLQIGETSKLLNTLLQDLLKAVNHNSGHPSITAANVTTIMLKRISDIQAGNL